MTSYFLELVVGGLLADGISLSRMELREIPLAQTIILRVDGEDYVYQYLPIRQYVTLHCTTPGYNATIELPERHGP